LEELVQAEGESQGRRPTIADVARSLGISKATVSRALNARGGVDPATRERVLASAAQLGYVASSTARALSHGRSNCLGLLVPSLTWPWMLEVVRGVADVVERSVYSLMLYTTARGPDSERAFVSQVIPSGGIDGVILVVPDGMLPYVGRLAARGLPVVVIDDRGQHPEFPAVATTNRDGGHAATRHLVDSGRRRITMINGPVEYGCNRERLDGYRQALGEAGIGFEPDLVEIGDFTEEGGARAAARLLASGRAFDAVFAANDLMAMGAMRRLREAGRRVPDDVAIVGFDDIPAASQTHPPLTTVRQPLYEMGRAATEMVMAAVRGDAIERRVELPTSLIVRGSSGGESADPIPQQWAGEEARHREA
jgi:LacI family transcriptional regulator